jgi:hypothetical protein
VIYFDFDCDFLVIYFDVVTLIVIILLMYFEFDFDFDFDYCDDLF